MRTALAAILIAISPISHAANEASLNAVDQMMQQGRYGSAHTTLNRLAASGDAEAMHQLGIDYAKGRGGIAVDPVQAIEWFSKSALRGNPRAMTKLGLMYWEGRGTPKDPNKAIYWFQLASNKEEPNAHFLMAEAYLMGDGGLARDPMQAYIHMSLAQRYKHPTAMSKVDNLAKMLTPAQRRMADAIIDKRTPEEFRRKMENRDHTLTGVPARL